MSKVPKVAISAIAVVLVLAGAVVVYRETDLLTGSLVVLAGLMIAALLARRAAAREERDGMAEWEAESRASVDAADELFADWHSTTPINDEWSNPPAAPAPAPAPPAVAPPAPTSNGNGSHSTNGTNGTNGSNGNGHAPVAEPAAEAWDTAAPAEQGSDSWWDSSDSWDAPAPAAPPAPPESPVDEAPAPEVEPAAEPDPEPVDLTSSATGYQDDGYTTGELADFVGAAPADEADHSDDRDHGHGGPDADTREPVRAPEPAYASVAAGQEGRQSPIDWTGQGGRVNERVSSSDDILAASEATALPAEGSVAGGSELARLLAKVEARLRDYE